jgi:hypothetical protein
VNTEESRGGVVDEFVPLHEIIQATVCEAMLVSGVAPRVSAREVRDGYFEPGSVAADSMNLLHKGHDALDMLEDVISMNLLERTVGEGPGDSV